MDIRVNLRSICRLIRLSLEGIFSLAQGNNALGTLSFPKCSLKGNFSYFRFYFEVPLQGTESGDDITHRVAVGYAK